MRLIGCCKLDSFGSVVGDVDCLFFKFGDPVDCPLK